MAYDNVQWHKVARVLLVRLQRTCPGPWYRCLEQRMHAPWHGCVRVLVAWLGRIVPGSVLHEFGTTYAFARGLAARMLVPWLVRTCPVRCYMGPYQHMHPPCQWLRVYACATARQDVPGAVLRGSGTACAYAMSRWRV